MGVFSDERQRTSCQGEIVDRKPPSRYNIATWSLRGDGEDYNMGKLRVVMLLVAVLMISALTGCGTAKDGQPSVSSGSGETSTKQLGNLNSFTAVTLDGGSFSSADLAARDLTVINFWSVNCGPCVSEMPELAAFAKDMPDRIQVITVCLDGGGAEVVEAVQALMTQAGYDGVTLIGGNGDLIDMVYRIVYMPTTILVDSQGNMVGDPIIGSPRDFEKTYTAAVNAALGKLGKDGI